MFNIGLMQGFAGLSLFSVLLLMGLGLAIIFGQMGVINMAHGEFMTIRRLHHLHVFPVVRTLRTLVHRFVFPGSDYHCILSGFCCRLGP